MVAEYVFAWYTWMSLLSLLISCTNHIRLDWTWGFRVKASPLARSNLPFLLCNYVHICFVKRAEHETSYSPVLTFLQISRNSDCFIYIIRWENEAMLTAVCLQVRIFQHQGAPMHNAFFHHSTVCVSKIALTHMDTKHVARGKYRKTCFKSRLRYNKCAPREASIIWQPQEFPAWTHSWKNSKTLSISESRQPNRFSYDLPNFRHARNKTQQLMIDGNERI